jgi:hypothetical protein
MVEQNLILNNLAFSPSKAEHSTMTKGTICEVSKSQRYKASTLAGTQNPQHKSQPAKELTFLLGLGNSL